MEKLSIEDFIKNHKHVNYCEAIIYPDGQISYVKPSHLESMIEFSGETREEIDFKMPINAIPILWLANYSNCMPVWSRGYIKPEAVTNQQMKSLKMLVKIKLVDGNDMYKKT